MSSYQRMLRVGGYLNFAVALAHVALFLGMLFAIDQLNAVTGTLRVHIGPPSGGWVGWIRLSLMVAGVVGFVSVLGLYGLSGAGRIRRLPLLRTGLIFTTVLFTFHGTYQILGKVGRYEALAAGKDVHPLLALIPVWKLTIGILYLAGTVGLWKTLGRTSERTACSNARLGNATCSTRSADSTPCASRSVGLDSKPH